MSGKMLTILEAAELLGLGRDRVAFLINSKQLPAVNVSVRVGARRPTWRIKAEDLETFIQSRSTRPKPMPERKPKAPKPARQWV